MEAAESFQSDLEKEVGTRDQNYSAHFNRVRERFMPSSHTYPVAAKLTLAATLFFGIGFRDFLKISHGSLPFRWMMRCPDDWNAPLWIGYKAHLGFHCSEVPQAIFDMHLLESRCHFPTCHSGFVKTVWGLPRGHLHPLPKD